MYFRQKSLTSHTLHRIQVIKLHTDNTIPFHTGVPSVRFDGIRWTPLSTSSVVCSTGDGGGDGATGGDGGTFCPKCGEPLGNLPRDKRKIMFNKINVSAVNFSYNYFYSTSATSRCPLLYTVDSYLQKLGPQIAIACPLRRFSFL